MKKLHPDRTDETEYQKQYDSGRIPLVTCILHSIKFIDSERRDDKVFADVYFYQRIADCLVRDVKSTLPERGIIAVTGCVSAGKR